MPDVIIEKINDVFIGIRCERSIAMEMSDYFSFFAKNYRWSPAYKSKKWDGKIRLFKLVGQKMYAGLIYEVIQFCIDRSYSLKVEDDVGLAGTGENASEDFLDSLKLPFKPYAYQLKALNLILNRQRRLLMSPTSSGKSLIIYLAARYLHEYKRSKKTLIVVPSTTLVEQLFKDFDEYAENIDWNSDNNVHRIYDYDGVTKDTDKPIVISTWHSIYKSSKEWFNQFDSVFVDEAHLARANSIQGIMNKLENCPYRIGLTGTLDGTETHKLVLTGLFGRVFITSTTKELMDSGIVSNLKIKAILLDHNQEERKRVSKLGYADEIDKVISDERRNNFIHKLATSQKGNTLVLFNRVEKHGIPLFEQMKKNSNGKILFIVHGKISTEEREHIRAYAEKNDNVVIVASYGTFSTGINIKNLQNLIFAHPYKARIKNLQSIGRSLRKSNKSSESVLYDIGDDYQWKSKKNSTLKHFEDRLRIYDSEEFSYSLVRLELK